MNTNDVIERAMPFVTPFAVARQVDARDIGWAIEMKIPAALEVLARNIAMDPQRRDLLSAVFEGTLVAGVADLATLITTERILLDRLPSAEIFLADKSVNTHPFQWVGSQGELGVSRISDAYFIHCCLSGTILSTRDTDGDLTSLNEDITIQANRIPTLAQLPFRLEGEFLGLVAAEAQRELGLLQNMPRGQRTPSETES